MKIGICARTWGEKGGIGVYTRSLLKNMIAIDKKNEYSIYYSDPHFIGTFTANENVREIHIPGKNKIYWDQIGVPYYSRKEDVDIIFHTKFSVPFLTKRKTAMVVHGSERLIYKTFRPRYDIVYFNMIYPRYLKKASLILAVADRGRLDMIEKLGIKSEKIKTIHLAANPVFRVIEDTDILKRIREKYNLPKRFILWVGHIYPGKNVGSLIKAFSKVREQEELDLVLVGSKRWKFEKDLSYIEKLNLVNNVHLLGHVLHDDLVAIYNLAEMLSFPSFYESFPAPPLEANACGCPVVASRTGGMPESAGEAAIYVEPTDIDGIAEAMLKVLTDEKLRIELIKKGFENIKRFSWEKTARLTLEALESVVD